MAPSTSFNPDLFKPTLALDVELDEVKFPCTVQEKHNGVRFVKLNGLALTRTLKTIPNHHIRNYIQHQYWDNIEGEILVPGATGVNEVVSAVMAVSGHPSFRLILFDAIDVPQWSYETRHGYLTKLNLDSVCSAVTSTRCNTREDLDKFVAHIAECNGEGVIIRYNISYKPGRSSKSHPGLLRHVSHCTDVATILACEELMTNTNPAYIDELGRTKRSTSQDGMFPTNTLGALLVTCRKFPKPFRVGTGFSLDQRVDAWYHRTNLIGKTIEFEYKPTTVIEVPAPAVFKRFVGAPL